MAEIWNLNTLCRCCHSDGCFKSLNLPYQGENGVEMYEIMLLNTFAIKISTPPLDASYTICDECIKRLRDATQFREQVLACESKFQIYCTNEQFLNSTVESIKAEVESNANENDDNHVELDYGIELRDDIPPAENKSDINVKKEIKKEGDIKNPNKQVKEETKAEISNRTKREHMRRKLYEPYIMQMKHKTGVTYSCKTCGGSYNTKKDLLKHINWQHLRRLKCEKCGDRFEDSGHLRGHLKKHFPETFKCFYCGKEFPGKKALKGHEKIHKDEFVYQCDICEKKLKYKTTLRKHILQMHSTENKKLLCDFCGRSFKQKCNLEAHIKTVHLKQRPYACTVCGKTYTAKKHVKNHMKIAHSGNPRPYHCDSCGRRFACPKSLKTHRMTHDNQFICRYCPLIFNSKKELDEHTKMGHTEVHPINGPFECHRCGKFLTTKFSLNRHLELHIGIKRFPCNICGMKFSQKSLLKRHHRRKHDPSVKIEKTKCDFCKKMVRDLDKHMESHDNDKRKFFCDICGKSYSENNALTRHKNQSHYGVSYDCDICGKKYIKKKSLETHKFKIHKVKKEIDEQPRVSEDIEMANMT